MAIIGDALRQAFMLKHECGDFRGEEKGWGRLQRPLVVALASVVWLAVLAAVSVSMRIVFPGKAGGRPFCRGRRVQALSLGEYGVRRYRGAFYLTDDEAADYYWMVVLIPSAIVFFASAVYLLAACFHYMHIYCMVILNSLLLWHTICIHHDFKCTTGMVVAYSASSRHSCLKMVENTYCASKRGGIRCLSILNIVFAVVFGLLALFLGSSLLMSGSNCSIPLFWCYEIASWGLVVLYGGTAFFLRWKACVTLHQGDLAARNLDLEMLESRQEVTSYMERQ